MFSALSLLAQSSSYTTNYTSYSSSNSDPATAGAVLLMMLIIYIPLFIVLIVGLIGMWKTFVKAGRPGWYAIVPVYNGMVLAEIAGRPNWWGLGFLVSPINVVVAIIFGMDIAKRFGRSETFGVVALGLFSFVGYTMIGFGKDVYDPTATPTHK